MQIYRRIGYTLLFILCYGHPSLGQAFDPQGAIQEAEFIIKKERTNVLQEFPKLYKPAPLLAEDTPLPFQYTWDWEHTMLQFQPIEHKIKLLRMQPDRLEEVYSNCFRIGHGNYYTPYFMAFLTNTLRHTYVYDIELSHLSAGRNAYLETYHNQAQVAGKLFTNSVILTHTIHYQGDKYPFVGLAKGKPLQAPDSTRYLVYHQGKLTTALYNRISGAFNYNLQVEGEYMHQKKIKEPQATIRIHLNRQLTATLRANMDTSMQLMQHRHPTARSSKLRNVLMITPSVDTTIQKLEIRTGIKAVYQNDKHAFAKQLWLYPAIRISYALHDACNPYVTLDGEMKPHSFATYSQQNPWIHGAVPIQYVNKPISSTIGMLGDIFNLEWHAGITISRYQNYPCFTNNVADPRTFDIQYDSSAIVAHEIISISRYSLETALKTRVQVQFYQYKLTNLQAPWYRPTYQLTLLNTYNFHDKLFITQEVLWEGGRKATATHTLDSCLDLALGLEYFWNQRFVIFIDWQNILARTNQVYRYTPTYGSHIIAGIGYRW